jgi:hypothetical protein
MRRETEELLALVRDTQDPTRTDEERVLGALQASVAAGLSSSVVMGSWLESVRLGKATAKLGTFGSKLSVIAACTAAAFGTADTAQPSAMPMNTASQSVDVRPSSPPLATSGMSDRRQELTEPVGPVLPMVPAVQRPTTQGPTTQRAASQRVATLRRELELLGRVQTALQRGDGVTALRELDTHTTRDRRLLAEREAARIVALCLLGRVAEARHAAERFGKQHPGSVQHEAIATSCANPQRIVSP